MHTKSFKAFKSPPFVRSKQCISAHELTVHSNCQHGGVSVLSNAVSHTHTSFALACQMDEHGLPIVGSGVDYTKVSKSRVPWFRSEDSVEYIYTRFVTHRCHR